MQRYSMTPEQIDSVRNSFDVLWPFRRKLAEQFYGRFFELAPDTRRLFPDGGLVSYGPDIPDRAGPSRELTVRMTSTPFADRRSDRHDQQHPAFPHRACGWQAQTPGDRR